MNQNNPLRQYFRQPAIYVKLPSQGKFYPDGGIDLPPNGEMPIYPMTAIDEITYRTPDALFNGQAMVNVFHSTVPNIRNGWDIPAMDIDTLLISVRIASYGPEMDFGTTCPNCSHESEHTLDLRSVLDRMRTPDYSKTIRSGDMEIYFRPMTYKNLNDNNQSQFEEQKVLQMIPDTNIPETDKITAMNNALKKITEITVQALSQSIAMVNTPNAMVQEPEFIQELLQNCDRKLFNQIREHIVSLKEQAEMQPMELTCPECSHKYLQSVTLDMTSFFGGAS